MSQHIVLLRGVNLGSRNRVAMPALRDALANAGFDDVRTYLQSGNVVLSSRRSRERVSKEVEKAIAEAFGLEIATVVRTRDDLAAVVRKNPLADVAKDPKRYQVTFLAKALPAEKVRELAELAHPKERFVAGGRELYAWHPNGIGRSKLWSRLASRDLGVTATARNWSTVTSLLELADEHR